MRVGLEKVIPVGTEISLTMKNELLVEFSFQAFKAQKVLITVKITGKPESASNPVVLKKVENTYSCKKINSGVVV